jgi:signal transduction histidine kinase
MKLTATLHALVVVGLLLVVAAFGVFSYRRETGQFETDMRRDAAVLGRALSSAAAYAWRAESETRARQLVTRAGGGESLIRVRWIVPDAPAEPRPLLPLGHLPAHGRSVTVRDSDRPAARGIYTYVPVEGPDGGTAVLELYEPLSGLEAHTRASARNLVIMAIALVLVGMLFVGVVGVKLIGRRMRQLVTHARRIGEGDLGSRVDPRGHDEITELGRAMNRMADDLERSRDRILEESRSRIRALEQLRHTERVATLGQLSAGMAHEMGTPLNVISGRAKLIASTEPLNDDARESSRIIVEQADRMTDTIRQFLDYGRPAHTRKAPVDVVEVLEAVVKMLEPGARRRGVTLELRSGDGISRAMLDRSQMQQVFMNLIRNGIQSMPAGGRLELDVAVDPDGDSGGESVEVRVRDEGTGITPEHRERIFEPFFSTKGSGHGVGLGLSIVRGIVEEHGGTVVVESEPGRGSCFRVRLPLGAPAGDAT